MKCNTAAICDTRAGYGLSFVPALQPIRVQKLFCVNWSWKGVAQYLDFIPITWLKVASVLVISISLICRDLLYLFDLTWAFCIAHRVWSNESKVTSVTWIFVLLKSDSSASCLQDSFADSEIESENSVNMSAKLLQPLNKSHVTMSDISLLLEISLPNFCLRWFST